MPIQTIVLAQGHATTWCRRGHQHPVGQRCRWCRDRRWRRGLADLVYALAYVLMFVGLVAGVWALVALLFVL